MFCFCRETERERFVSRVEALKAPSKRAPTVTNRCSLISSRALGEGKSEEKGVGGRGRDDCELVRTNYRHSPTLLLAKCQSESFFFFRETRDAPLPLFSTLCLISESKRMLCLAGYDGERSNEEKAARAQRREQRGRSASFFVLPHANSESEKSRLARSLRRRRRRRRRPVFFHFFLDLLLLDSLPRGAAPRSFTRASVPFLSLRPDLCSASVRVARERRDGGQQRQRR